MPQEVLGARRRFGYFETGARAIQILQKIEMITDRFVKITSVVAGALMAALTLVVFLSVVSRYFFSLPIRATGELAGLLFAWLVFLATVAVTHNEDNIAITYFRGLLPVSLQKIVIVITRVIILAFVVAILISSFQLSMVVFDTPLPSLRISSAWLYGSVALPFVGVAFVVLLQIVVLLVGRASPQDERDKYTPPEDSEELEVREIE